MLVVVLGVPLSALLLLAFALSIAAGRGDFVPLKYNLRSLFVRRVSTLLAGFVLALVVAAFAAMMMLSSGIEKTLAATGLAENAKVTRKGSGNEVQSGLLPDQVRLVTASPEVAKATDGQPAASSEMVVLIFALREHATTDQDGSNLLVRGVGPRALDVHSTVKIEGRMLNPGTSEVVVGKKLIGKFEGIAEGGKLRFARRDWNVVGILDSGNSGFDSEIWGDVDQFADAFQRRGGVSSVTLRLADPAMLGALEARLLADPQLAQLEVQRENDYYAKQSEFLAKFIRFLGLFMAVIFAFGAALCAMIMMYSQVAARTREIGTLRALGFRRRAVLVSFVVESTLLGLLSGMVGLALASFMRFFSFSTMNFNTFSEVSVRFALTPTIAIASLLFGALMGYAGGLLPAIRAARMPIVDATRGG
ncbi:MAG: FtsX-like permease family protein [Myxococcales bacterium]|nr:FtsX-like permease family protein [Myxococcales bacterium]